MNLLKLSSIALIIVLVLNMILFGFGIIPALSFWIILAGFAAWAFWGIPAIKKLKR